jgi:hypothetical protein
MANRSFNIEIDTDKESALPMQVSIDDGRRTVSFWGSLGCSRDYPLSDKGEWINPGLSAFLAEHARKCHLVYCADALSTTNDHKTEVSPNLTRTALLGNLTQTAFSGSSTPPNEDPSHPLRPTFEGVSRTYQAGGGEVGGEGVEVVGTDEGVEVAVVVDSLAGSRLMGMVHGEMSMGLIGALTLGALMHGDVGKAGLTKEESSIRDTHNKDSKGRGSPERMSVRLGMLIDGEQADVKTGLVPLCRVFGLAGRVGAYRVMVSDEHDIVVTFEDGSLSRFDDEGERCDHGNVNVGDECVICGWRRRV